MKLIPKIQHARGTMSAPPSKSYTARALVLAAMTEGETTIVDPLDSDDSRYLLEAIRAIGYEVSGSLQKAVTIGERTGISAGEVELYVGNAGTAMRFLTGFLAFTPGRFILRGESRMYERPIGDLVDVLRGLDCEVEYLENEGFPPISIRGKKMRGGFEVSVAGGISSQFVSALLLGGATLPGGIRVRVTSLNSRPYVEITLDILRSFGASVEAVDRDVFRVIAKNLVLPTYRVEGDYSSASYWFAAAAVTAGRVEVANLESRSAQGDRRFLDLLERIGCSITWKQDRRVEIQGPPQLAGGTFDCSEIPDVVPTLAAIAPFASAAIRIEKIGTLRVKESDRISAVAEELRKLGASVSEGDDWLQVEPGIGSGPAEIDPHGDHRLAMSFAVAGLARGGVTISNEQVVSKSYPRFWRSFDELVSASES